jgi:hypothetical protein
VEGNFWQHVDTNLNIAHINLRKGSDGGWQGWTHCEERTWRVEEDLVYFKCS